MGNDQGAVDSGSSPYWSLGCYLGLIVSTGGYPNQPAIRLVFVRTVRLVLLFSFKAFSIGIAPKGAKDLAEVFANQLSIVCQQSWLTREVPINWRWVNVMPIPKKGRKEDLEYYRPQCRGMSWCISSCAIKQYVLFNQVIRPSKCGFMPD